MATTTQYNPNIALNARLLASGASKTVYALVTPETEAVKAWVFGDHASEERNAYLEQFRDAWTAKQDAYHTEFFDVWHEWSKPVVELDRGLFPFFYPTAGASEPLRHLIFEHAAKGGRAIHVFEGEYEGYKAMAEAAGLKVIEHQRDGKDGWHTPFGGRLNRIASAMNWSRDLFFISQPSAIDGNVWPEFNEFISKMPPNSVVADLTYVGAVPERAINRAHRMGENAAGRFNMNQPAIRNVVFSLSKPFGAYYDRIGGVFCREENLGLFGNKWFKSLSALAIGTALMKAFDVFYMPDTYGPYQRSLTARVAKEIGIHLLEPSDVFLLATGTTELPNELADYLTRAGKVRLCLTAGMAAKIGTSGPIAETK
jgi:hypothetical protein